VLLLNFTGARKVLDVQFISFYYTVVANQLHSELDFHNQGSLG